MTPGRGRPPPAGNEASQRGGHLRGGLSRGRCLPQAWRRAELGGGCPWASGGGGEPGGFKRRGEVETARGPLSPAVNIAGGVWVGLSEGSSFSVYSRCPPRLL